MQTCDADIARMRASYEQRRESMHAGLAEIPCLTPSAPEGAFYQFPRYDLEIPSAELVARLREFGVIANAGEHLGVAAVGAVLGYVQRRLAWDSGV